MKNDRFFSDAIFKVIGKRPAVKNIRYQGGGCINNSAIIDTSEGPYFIKFNSRTPANMFEKEYRGLKLLRTTDIHVPESYGFGEIDNVQFILLEAVKSSSQEAGFWNDFGSRLARLHKNNIAPFFGLDYDNYIGRLPQVNNKENRWVDFFINNRLEYQLRLALESRLVNHSLVDQFRKFYKLLPGLLPDEKPSLLHGDLWAGNFMTGSDGYVILIDPAVYYGNREAELSFTKMFGGFDETFYSSYNDEWPLEKNFEDRVDIYNLYPALVHLNLFGTSYLPAITRLIDRYR